MAIVIAVVIALIGAVSGIAGTILSLRAQQRVMGLSSTLEEQRAESDARRAYEYDARKRLYEVYEPLRVQMLDCADNAVSEMADLAGWPGPGRPGYSSAEYRVKASVYYLLAPLVVARMIERRLTLVDLSLDTRIYTEYVLAQAISRSLAEEFIAAELQPPLRYTPYVEGWREKRLTEPQRYRRQGLPLGRLNTALDFLHLERPGNVDGLLTFGEFEPKFAGLETNDVRSGPGAARDLFEQFDPGTRPLLWRVMVIQALLYWCYERIVFGEGIPQLASLSDAFSASSSYRSLRSALRSRPDQSGIESLETTIGAAASYVAEQLEPGLRRAQLLSGLHNRHAAPQERAGRP